MSPRSLLFSSNEERSRQLIQALHELELEVEHCPEIFSAVERLTSRSFDVVVADLDEGPEARFLLKTSRELKLNKSAFAFAVASEATKVAASEIVADLLYAKALNPDQIKYALLTCDGFLACLKIWLTRDSARTVTAQIQFAVNQSAVNQGPPPTPQPAVRAMAAPSDKPSPVPTRELREDPAALNLTFATLDRKFYRSFNLAKARPDSRKPGSRRATTRLSRFLGTAAIVVAFFSLGYAFSQPAQLHHGLADVKMAYTQALEVGKSWADGLGSIQATNSAAMAEADIPQPLRFLPRRTPAAPVPPSVSEGISGTGLEALLSQTHPDQDLAYVGAPGARIPQSLRVVQPGSEMVRSVGARIGASLLSELEPVSLSEELSAQLLLEKVQPTYPEQALKAGLQGPVVLQAWIGRDGTIRELKLIRGSLLLGQAAYNAVKQWRYKPYLRNGEAVEAQTYVTIDFRLPQQSLLSPLPR